MVREISRQKMEVRIVVKSTFAAGLFGQKIEIKIPTPKNTASVQSGLGNLTSFSNLNRHRLSGSQNFDRFFRQDVRQVQIFSKILVPEQVLILYSLFFILEPTHIVQKTSRYESETLYGPCF